MPRAPLANGHGNESNTMKTEHTAGPWSVATDEDWDGATVYAGKSYPAHARVVAVCEGSDIPGQWGECRTEEAKANARLIASAPDLMAALEGCITSEGAACFGDMKNHPEWMQRRLYAISDIARAAITKAKGQE